MKKLLLLSICFLAINAIAQQAKPPAYVSQRSKNAKQANRPVVNQISLSTGVELEYAEQGNPGGVPIIFLHGFTDSWKSFAPVLPYLPVSLHVFALSQRGHGASSKSATSYLPEDFAADLSAFLQAKEIRQAIIVGHSMGSTNAQCFVARYPQQAKALVLIGAFADYNKPILTEFKTVIDSLTNPIDSTFVADFQKSTLTRPIGSDQLQVFIDESRKVPAHVWKGVAAGWPSATLLPSLSSFAKPTLIIWGEKDTYSTLDDQFRLQSALQQSTILKYEGIGHASHWEAPERVARDLVNFIQTYQLHHHEVQTQKLGVDFR